MPTFAAIDIGSNSCRLKIAKVVAHQLKTLAEDREVTRLGASVFESGLVSPEAMALTLRALKRFQRAVQAHGVDQIRVVATSAMRDARNGAAFQAWVKAETGWTMEIISGLEEGRLIHLGVTGAEQGAGGKALLIDLGGGSCEITLSEHKRIKETISVPLGAVRLTEDFLSADPAPAEGLARMRQWIQRELRRAHRKIQPGKVPLVIATSGTAAALSDAYAAGVRLNNRQVSERASQRVSGRRTCRTIVPAGAVRKLSKLLAKMTLPEREAVPGLGRGARRLLWPGRRCMRNCWRALGWRGFGIRRWGCGTAFWRRCWPSRMRGPRRTRSLSMSGGRACWRRRGGMESIPSRRSRCGRMRCNCFAS